MAIKTMPAATAQRIIRGEVPAPVQPMAGPLAAALEVSFHDGDSKAVEGLNKTERRYLEILLSRQRRGEIVKVRVQAFTLRLANSVRYTPDFSAVVNGRMKFFETKGGFIREDSWQKLKIAAAFYPEFDFIMAQEIKRQWEETEIPK